MDSTSDCLTLGKRLQEHPAWEDSRRYSYWSLLSFKVDVGLLSVEMLTLIRIVDRRKGTLYIRGQEYTEAWPLIFTGLDMNTAQKPLRTYRCR
ncbi:protein of unknown function [Nitrospira japonica]|uniref:Uncharacterized protein n=1 Tax=Nitrospira japonica TaxID=1325564 RepID=A0A1W1I514_9BACT|nr:protein of unknown function [Nitrospira japonica]